MTPQEIEVRLVQKESGEITGATGDYTQGEWDPGGRKDSGYVVCVWGGMTGDAGGAPWW